MTPANRGLLVGAWVGFIADFLNWEGDSRWHWALIVVGAAIGWTIGYYIGKRRIL